MKNWSLNMRDGTDSINFDFETNDSRFLAEKLNSFLGVCGTMTSPASLVEELHFLRTGVEAKVASVYSAGNDPAEEERLTQILHSVTEVIEYVESEL